MASSHSRCIFKYSLFMLACLHIISRLNHEMKEIDYVNSKARKDTYSTTTYYLYNPTWKTIAQPKCLRSNTSTGLLITPRPYKPRSNKTATNFTVLLCIILSGDIQLNPGPSKCNSCKKSLKSNSLILKCNDCNKSVHIKCAGISRHEFDSIYRNLDTWHCSDCSAPCSICHRDVLNNHIAIHCDHCQNICSPCTRTAVNPCWSW